MAESPKDLAVLPNALSTSANAPVKNEEAIRTPVNLPARPSDVLEVLFDASASRLSAAAEFLEAAAASFIARPNANASFVGRILPVAIS